LVAAPMTSLAQGSGKFKVARTLYVAGPEIQAGTYDVNMKSVARMLGDVHGSGQSGSAGKRQSRGRR
jgi:hypothetical protein